jgi:hypothetical protein
MNYSEVINKAWKYVWKHKILWLFALFAGSLVGVSFSFPGNFSSSRWHIGQRDGEWFNQMPPFMRNRMPEMWQDIRSANPLFWIWVVIAIVVVVLILSAISLLLSTAGRGGLIKGLLLAEDKNYDQKLSFKEIWQAMKPYFWRLLLLRLFIGVAVSILSVILGILFVVITIVTLGLALCLIVPLVLLSIPIGWLVKAVIANASIALVDEDLDIFKAIARSWQVVTNNIWSMLLVMLFNTLISIGTALVVLFPFVLISTPFLLMGFRGGELSQVAWVVLAILFALAFVLALFIGMWVNTLIHGIFVVSYRRLKYQVSTPIRKSELVAPVPVQAEWNVASAVDTGLPENLNPEVAIGNEPAPQEPDEVNPEH